MVFPGGWFNTFDSLSRSYDLQIIHESRGRWRERLSNIRRRQFSSIPLNLWGWTVSWQPQQLISRRTFLRLNSTRKFKTVIDQSSCKLNSINFWHTTAHKKGEYSKGKRRCCVTTCYSLNRGRHERHIAAKTNCKQTTQTCPSISSWICHVSNILNRSQTGDYLRSY